MSFLNSWLQGIIVAVVVATIIELIMPNGNNKKYIKVLLGVYILFNIISPIINKFTGEDFKLSSIIDMTEYTQDIDEYKAVSSNINIDALNENSIKQIYISNLKNDITAKIEDKEYIVNKIDVEIENNDNYDIKSISVNIIKSEANNEEKESNKFTINEIEKVEIKIGEYKEEIEENKTVIAQKDINEIKDYLSTTYNVKEEKINIY